MASKQGAEPDEKRPLETFLDKLDTDYRKRNPPLYDSDAFDSMAAINSEIWNAGENDEEPLTKKDILPNGLRGISKEDLGVAFLKAAETGVLEAVKDLHEFCGPQILSATDDDQYTALHRATYNGHIPVVEYLLSVGANVESRTVDGWQPLHCACRWNKVGVASLLLQNGAVVNAQTNGKQTPLHLAACNDRAKETLELLLRTSDMDVNLVNGQGDRAYQLAERSGPYAYLFQMVDESIDDRKFLREVS